GTTLLIPPLSFDASLAAIFGTLCSGGTLLICSKEDLQDTRYLARVVPQLDTLLCVPTYYNFLLSEGILKTSQLRRVIVGGEPLKPKLVQDHFRSNPTARLYNEYGPTETSIWATVEELKSADSEITIGYPVEGAELLVLNPEGQLVDLGTVGELYISGKGIARGYLNDPIKTSERFLLHPLHITKGRLYRTGDLVKQLPNGKLVFVGRVDNQVKINGYRIEISEIETALSQIAKIESAIVTATTTDNFCYLTAFVQSNEHLDTEQLKTALKKILPEYMIPSIWVQMDRLPLTANGKIDRKALQNFDITEKHTAYNQKPTDPIETRLRAIWKSYFPVQDLDLQDSFFDGGGNSMAAMAIVTAIRKEFSIELSIKDFFEKPTLASVAGKIREASTSRHDNIKATAASGQVPLSFGQESFWLIDQLGESVAYHLPIAFEVRGRVNVQALTSAFHFLLERHETLRTVVEEVNYHQYQRLLPTAEWKL